MKNKKKRSIYTQGKSAQNNNCFHTLIIPALQSFKIINFSYHKNLICFRYYYDHSNCSCKGRAGFWLLDNIHAMNGTIQYKNNIKSHEWVRIESERRSAIKMNQKCATNVYYYFGGRILYNFIWKGKGLDYRHFATYIYIPIHADIDR